MTPISVPTLESRTSEGAGAEASSVAHRPDAPAARARQAEPDELASKPRYRQALALIVGIGLALRLLQYTVARSLWLDEALIAVNILERSFGGLLEPLSGGQTAPYGFLVLQKLAVTAFGGGELVLRAVPFLAGVAALFLFAALARRYLSRQGFLLALALFAVSPFLVYYAAEVKQYSTDVAIALLVWLAADRLDVDGRSARRVLGFGALGAVAIWFSLTSVFVLAGTTAVLLLVALRKRDLRATSALSVASAVWGTSFAASYIVSRGSLADGEYMRSFWEAGFMPFPPRSIDEWLWFPRTLFRVFQDPLGGLAATPGTGWAVGPALVALLAFGVGVAWAARRHRVRLALLMSPVVLTLLASGAEAYPFGGDGSMSGRVLLFLVPAFFLLIAEGAVRAANRLRGGLAPAGFTAIALVLLLPGLQMVRLTPYPRNEVKPLLAHLGAEWRPGDLLYVHYNARPAFEYYRQLDGFPNGQYRVGSCARLTPADYLAELESLRGRGRTWFLFAGSHGGLFGYDEEGLMVSYLEAAAERLDDRVATGASLYLYDLSDTGAVSAGWQVPVFHADPRRGCRGPWAADS